MCVGEGKISVCILQVCTPAIQVFLHIFSFMCVPVALCVCAHALGSQTRCNNWRPSCGFHTINMTTLEVMKVNQRLKAGLVLKRLSESPLPFPQLSPQWLINTISTFTALQPLYFLSLCFPHHKATQCYSRITLYLHLFISDHIFRFVSPIFLHFFWNISRSPSLSFIF